ncbi:MAG TPA: response regulator [Vicinamibacteria bacterium]|nr:response regulator [Vicinamibacteria bacterium]
MAPAQGRILVVDDEADVRSLLSRVLRDAGYSVDTADDGGEALARLEANRPDLVLLDLMMPGVDGWGVLAELRKEPSPPPVVLVTASADPATFGRGVREGVAGYIAKPFRFRDLLSTCERVLLDSRKQGQPPLVDRRRDPRRALMVEVRVIARDLDSAALGELVDFGPGGAQVYLEAALEPGTAVRLAFRVPGAGEAYSFAAQVCWRRDTPRGTAHGLAFVDLDPAATRRLTELVKPRRS